MKLQYLHRIRVRELISRFETDFFEAKLLKDVEARQTVFKGRYWELTHVKKRGGIHIPAPPPTPFRLAFLSEHVRSTLAWISDPITGAY